MNSRDLTLTVWLNILMYILDLHEFIHDSMNYLNEIIPAFREIFQ